MFSIERIVARQLNTSPELPPVIVLYGPGSTGKTHLAKSCFPTHRHSDLALPSEASRAEHDPESFLTSHPPPVILDEVHLAPRLLAHLGHLAETTPLRPAGIVLAGRRPTMLAAAARDAFGKRALLVRVDGLSHTESVSACPTLSIEERLLRGGFPALYADLLTDVPDFMRSRIADFLDRDLPQRIRVDSVHDFERFLRSVALRTGRPLNKAELARETGIVGSTAAIWLDVLVDAGLVTLLRPAPAASGRPAVKSSKIYFVDPGLCAHLIGLRSVAELATSPRTAALWETHVCAEIRRLTATMAPASEPLVWRDRTREADFLVRTPRGLVLLDAAWSQFPTAADHRRMLRIREEIGVDQVAGTAIVCRTPRSQSLREPAAGPAVETIGLDDIAAVLG